MKFLMVVMISLLVSCLLTASPALAQACTSEVLSLHQSYPAPIPSTSLSPINVQFTLEATHLKAHFNVQSEHTNAKPILGPNEYPYQRDVVELFVSVGGTSGLPYYEFEVSPYDQTFQVKILDPHQAFIDGVQMGIGHSATLTSTGWSVDLMVPLENLAWDGNPQHITGNAYSVQGLSPHRTFWSLSLPTQAHPNFHLPQYFKAFFDCQPGSGQ